MKSNYEIWDCRQTVWNTQFYGKMVDGKLYPPDRLHRVFFRPAYAGQTFGFGQLSPVAALMVTDVVHAKSGLPLLSIGNASQVYQQIMNPDTSLSYVAANIRVVDRPLQEHRRHRHFQEPRRDRDALQSR